MAANEKAATARDASTRVELQITGMHCAACAGTVSAALQRVPGVASADVSFAAGLALVRASPEASAESIRPELLTERLPERLIAAVRAAGYAAAPAGATAERALW